MEQKTKQNTTQGEDFKLQALTLPALGATQVEVKIRMVGLCHTDIHFRDNDMGNADYPLLAGHEGVGEVVQTGRDVRTLKIGDRVGLGWIRDSCDSCKNCKAGRENICYQQYQGIYLGKSAGPWGSLGKYNEHGGCFTRVQRIEETFAVNIPKGLPDSCVCPLLCGGATMYEPLCNHARAGSRVGVLGLGGLGRCGVKLGKLLNCHIVVISSTSTKREAALQCGADDFWVMNNEHEHAVEEQLDLIIDTRPVNGPVDQVMKFLRNDGVYCRVGLPSAADQDFSHQWIPHIFMQQSITGSTVTGTKRMNEMFQLCADNVDYILKADDAFNDVEIIPFAEINNAMHKLSSRTNKSFRYLLKW